MALGSVEFLHHSDWMLLWSFANLGGKKKKPRKKKKHRIESQLINHDVILFQSLLISLPKKPRRSGFIKIK